MAFFQEQNQHQDHNKCVDKCVEKVFISQELDEEQREQRIESIAYLARLHLTEEEKKTFSRDLANVFQWIDQLNHLCPEGGVDDLSGPVVGLQSLREDLPWDSSMNPRGSQQPHEGPLEVLKNAPKTYQHYVLVPKIIES